jgi:hypothetical protein
MEEDYNKLLDELLDEQEELVEKAHKLHTILHNDKGCRL